MSFFPNTPSAVANLVSKAVTTLDDGADGISEKEYREIFDDYHNQWLGFAGRGIVKSHLNIRGKGRFNVLLDALYYKKDYATYVENIAAKNSKGY